MQHKETDSLATLFNSGQTSTRRFAPCESIPREAVQGGAVGSGKCHYIESAHTFRKPRMPVSDVEKPLVLHVDDDVDLVDAVTSRLNAGGFRVASAIDGMAGIQSALIFPVSVVILDFDMPNGRGDTVIDLLKANEKTKDIPIVVLTAAHKKGLKRELLNKGANAFMTKPFEYTELEKTIKELIN